jgi:hypothetical protein
MKLQSLLFTAAYQCAQTWRQSRIVGGIAAMQSRVPDSLLSLTSKLPHQRYVQIHLEPWERGLLIKKVRVCHNTDACAWRSANRLLCEKLHVKVALHDRLIK